MNERVDGLEEEKVDIIAIRKEVIVVERSRYTELLCL